MKHPWISSMLVGLGPQVAPAEGFGQGCFLRHEPVNVAEGGKELDGRWKEKSTNAKPGMVVNPAAKAASSSMLKAILHADFS